MEKTKLALLLVNFTDEDIEEVLKNLGKSYENFILKDNKCLIIFKERITDLDIIEFIEDFEPLIWHIVPSRYDGEYLRVYVYDIKENVNNNNSIEIVKSML